MWLRNARSTSAGTEVPSAAAARWTAASSSVGISIVVITAAMLRESIAAQRD